MSAAPDEWYPPASFTINPGGGTGGGGGGGTPTPVSAVDFGWVIPGSGIEWGNAANGTGQPTPPGNGYTASDSQYIYYTSTTSPGLWRINKRTRQIDNPWTGYPTIDGAACGICCDANFIYFQTQTQGIWKAPVGGGTATQLAANPAGGSYHEGLALDPNGAYLFSWWNQGGTSFNLYRIKIDGTNPTVIVNSPTGYDVRAVACDGSHVFFHYWDAGGVDSIIGRCNYDGSGRVTFASYPGANPVTGLACDATNLYVIRSGVAAIQWLPVAGGAGGNLVFSMPTNAYGLSVNN